MRTELIVVELDEALCDWLRAHALTEQQTLSTWLQNHFTQIREFEADGQALPPGVVQESWERFRPSIETLN